MVSSPVQRCARMRLASDPHLSLAVRTDTADLADINAVSKRRTLPIPLLFLHPRGLVLSIQCFVFNFRCKLLTLPLNRTSPLHVVPLTTNMSRFVVLFFTFLYFLAGSRIYAGESSFHPRGVYDGCVGHPKVLTSMRPHHSTHPGDLGAPARQPAVQP